MYVVGQQMNVRGLGFQKYMWVHQEGPGLPEHEVCGQVYLRVSQLTYSCNSRKAVESSRSYCIIPTLAWMVESWAPEPSEANP